MKTKDFKNPIVRQKFLKDAINKNLLIGQLSRSREDAEKNGLFPEAKMIGKMISFLERGTDIDFKDLRRSFRLRKLNLI